MTSRLSTSLSFEIKRRLNDTRLDSALTTLLQEQFPEKEALSRAFVARAITAGKVFLNGAVALPRALVSTHDIVTLSTDIFSEKQPSKASGKTIELEKLFENDQIVVLDKKAGVQMHRGGAHAGTTVAAWILIHYPQLAAVGEDPERPGIVHRLDRETSGVIVVAKNQESFQALKQAFQEREIEKTYTALVYGHLDDLEGKIDTALMRKSGELKRRTIDLEHATGTLPGTTRTALTYYRVIARYQDYDLLSVMPKTGRTHQVRVHLSSVGHPVVGDKLYAFKDIKRGKLAFPTRHMLHASRLSLTLFGKKYQFHSPLPFDFRKVLSGVDETKEKSYDDEALKSLF